MERKNMQILFLLAIVTYVVVCLFIFECLVRIVSQIHLTFPIWFFFRLMNIIIVIIKQKKSLSRWWWFSTIVVHTSNIKPTNKHTTHLWIPSHTEIITKKENFSHLFSLSLSLSLCIYLKIYFTFFFFPTGI